MRPVVGITAGLQDGRVILKEEYAAAVAAAGGCPLILPPLADGKSDAVCVSSVAGRIDGLLIPGGGDLHPEYYGEGFNVPAGHLNLEKRQRSDFELALLREIFGLRKPVLGVCYGMQILNVALGGTLVQDIQSLLPGAVDHRSMAHGVTVMPLVHTGKLWNPTIQGDGSDGKSDMVNSTHHQAVKQLGNGLEVFVLASDGIVEGFLRKGYPFLVGVQWHPERMPGHPLSDVLFEALVGACAEMAT